jgi:hypothetical protein
MPTPLHSLHWIIRTRPRATQTRASATRQRGGCQANMSNDATVLLSFVMTPQVSSGTAHYTRGGSRRLLLKYVRSGSFGAGARHDAQGQARGPLL